MHICAGSPEIALVENIIITWASSNMLHTSYMKVKTCMCYIIMITIQRSILPNAFESRVALSGDILAQQYGLA